MLSAIERLPDAPGDWTELARACGSFYHHPAWIDGIRECFGFPVSYFAAREAGCLVGGLATAEVPALVGKRRLVSFPFSYGAGPIARSPAASVALCEAARAHAVARRLA